MIIDRDKIDEAKQKLGDLNAEIMAELLGLEDYDKRNHKSLCPFHREDTGSFVYNSKGYYFKCFGCGKTVDLIGAHMHTGMTYIDACKKLFELSDTKYSFGEHKVKTKAQYKYPKEIEINDKAIIYKYLESRGISRSVVDYCDVRQDNHGNIAFNFYDTNDVLTMVKYRPSHKVDKKSGESKSWSQKDADTTPLLLNMNRINTAEPLLIAEGECDMLAAIQSGYMNTVSVPFGAGNFGWIEENWDWLEQFDSIIIGSDNDEAGLKMQKECIYRLGSWRTKIMDIPTSIDCDDGVTYKVKDINEFMFLAGEEQVMYAILNAKETPVESLIDFSDIKEVDLSQIDGVYTGIEEFDREMMRLFYGTFNILTGINGCVDSETEYFNGKEWKKISKYKHGDRVLQYNEDKTTSLVIPDRYHKYKCNKYNIISSSDGRVSQFVSDEHNMIYIDKEDNIIKQNVLDMINKHKFKDNIIEADFINTFKYNGVGLNVVEEELMLFCETIGSKKIYYKKDDCDFIDVFMQDYACTQNCKILLDSLKIEYSQVYNSITFKKPKSFYIENLYNCSSYQLEVVCNYIVNIASRNSEMCNTKINTMYVFGKNIADFLQFAMSTCGYFSSVNHQNEKDIYGLYFDKKSEQRSTKLTIGVTNSGDGYKYCFTVPSGMLVLRRDGIINVTGNSGKSSFLHQLIAQSVDQGKDVWLYSKELPNYMSKNWQDYIFAGGRHIIEYTNDRGSKYYRVTEEAKKEIDDHYRGRIKIYRDGWKNDLESIQTSMIESVRKFGSKLFIVDNLTAINFACGDNEKWGKQVDFVNWCIDFAQRYHVVLILVIHPKKIEAMRRLTKLDVAGLGSIVDLAHRLISLYRVSPKEKEGMKKMTGQGWASEPVKFDVILDVLKDRMRGRENMSIGLNYDVPSRRFFTNEEEYSYQYAWDKRKYKDKMFYPIVDDEEEVFGSK